MRGNVAVAEDRRIPATGLLGNREPHFGVIGGLASRLGVGESMRLSLFSELTPRVTTECRPEREISPLLMARDRRVVAETWIGMRTCFKGTNGSAGETRAAQKEQHWANDFHEIRRTCRWSRHANRTRSRSRRCWRCGRGTSGDLNYSESSSETRSVSPFRDAP